MSINTKLISGCLVFVLMIASLGWLNYRSDIEMRLLLEKGYKPAQEALAALHSARRQTAALEATLFSQERTETSAEPPSAVDRTGSQAALAAIVSALRAADGKTASLEAATALRRLSARLAPLDAAGGGVTRRKLLRDLPAADDDFEAALRAVQVEAGRLGGEAALGSQAELRRDLSVLGFCAAGAVVLSLWMSRALVARVGRSTRIARALAEGDLAVAIPAGGVREFDALFSALRDVRTSICAMSLRQEQRLLVQASTFDNTIETHRHRFAAALHNMPQALCMLDADLSLIVFNAPFAALFPHLKHGASADTLLADPRFNRFLAAEDTGTFVHETPDGEMLQVKRRGVRGGGLVITFEDVTEQHRTSKRLEHLAGHDGLTDLPNRRTFRERLEAALSDRARTQPVAVLCLDLDGFRAVNDTFGHPTGDALLRSAGERLAACAGPADVLARLGGDEFSILQTQGAQPAAAERLAAGIVAAFETPFILEGRPVGIGVSIGIGIGIDAADLARGSAVNGADLLMQNCDLALHQAKSHPGSSYKLYLPMLREERDLRRDTERDLRLAVERGEFELFYQPFVDTERRCISGFEALLRWRHPAKGMLLPSLFIPVAEELGLIREIGRWVLRQACAEAASWPAGMSVSVNLSPSQFRDNALVAEVDEALARSGLAAGRLQLDVTGSLLLDEAGDVLSILTALRRRGAAIAMDDFGTGYSSLGHLARFPFDKIKIDRSFVQGIGRTESLAVIRAVIGLSRSMGMGVIAEGIETPEQMHGLRAEGCKDMQGYLFSRPQPVADLPKLLMEMGGRWNEFDVPHSLPAAAA